MTTIPQQANPNAHREPGPDTPPEPAQYLATSISGAQLLITLLPDGGPPLVQMRIGAPWPSRTSGSWAPSYPVEAIA